MHYTNYSTAQLQLHYITTTTTAALHHPTSSQVTTAAIVTTPKSKIPITFQSISGFALPSVIHNHQPLL